MDPEMRYRLAKANMAELQRAAANERLAGKVKRTPDSDAARRRPHFRPTLYPVRALLAALPIQRSTAGGCD